MSDRPDPRHTRVTHARNTAAPAPRRRPGLRTAFFYALGIALAGLTATLLLPIRSDDVRPDDAPFIEILEPRVWAMTGGAGLVVESKRSVPVEGVARHSGPISEVRLNGRRLAMAFLNDRTAVEFSGFFDARDLRPDGVVEIEVRALSGARAVRRFPVRVATSGAGAPDFGETGWGERMQRWAVVVGIGDYADPAIPGSAHAADGARALADFLRSPAAGVGGFPDTHVRLLLDGDATARSIRSALTTFLRASTPDDLVLVYLAGMAIRDPDRPRQAYLLAHDTEIGDIPATAVELSFLSAALGDMYAHNRVIITDLTSPGAARVADPVSAALLGGLTVRQGGLIVLSGQGLFGRRLLDGLRGAADADGDGVVRLDEMIEYTRERVRLETRGARVPAISPTSYDRFWPMALVAPER